MMCDSQFIINAEYSLAGCLLVMPEETTQRIKAVVSSGDFLSDTVRRIYDATISLVNAERACDPVLIQAEASKAGTPIDTAFCADCMQLFVTTANAAETARIVHEAAMQRRAAEIGLALTTGSIEAVEALEQLQNLIRSQGSRILSPMETAQRVMDFISAAASGESKPFVKTEFSKLDNILSGGLASGGMITLAARPGTGKTTAALSIAENVAARNETVLYFSLEMTKEQLISCRAANIASISRSAIYSGEISDKQWPKLIDAFDEISKRPFLIRDTPSTVEDIEREARCIDGLSLIIVDHIGLIKPTSKGTRYEIMTDHAHRLKQLALSLKVPILTLCQLNRQSEQRETKRPSMADLRDSGAIEEDSDVVCLLFRPAQYAKPENRPKAWENQDIDFIIDKNRHGETGMATLNFNGYLSRVFQ